MKLNIYRAFCSAPLPNPTDDFHFTSSRNSFIQRPIILSLVHTIKRTRPPQSVQLRFSAVHFTLAVLPYAFASFTRNEICRYNLFKIVLHTLTLLLRQWANIKHSHLIPIIKWKASHYKFQNGQCMCSAECDTLCSAAFQHPGRVFGIKIQIICGVRGVPGTYSHNYVNLFVRQIEYLIDEKFFKRSQRWLLSLHFCIRCAALLLKFP